MVAQGPHEASFLLDSNVIVAAFDEEPAVLEKLGRVPTERLFIPAVALGELYFGALKSGRMEANLGRIEAFAMASNILGVDAAVARHYGEIRNGLRRIGRPIPENDIWISATARRHGLVLVSRDRHFGYVNDLDLEQW